MVAEMLILGKKYDIQYTRTLQAACLAVKVGSMDDDDDDVPPLEATRSRCDTKVREREETARVAEKQVLERPKDEGERQTNCDSIEEKNEVAEAMMQRALAAREQKKRDTEESRKKADGFGGGLKKGFLSSKPKASQTGDFLHEATNDKRVALINGGSS